MQALSRLPADFAVRTSLEQIRQREADVQAWVRLRRWDELERDIATAMSGSMTAIPFGVKDVIDVCGLPTQCGIDDADEPAAQYDAACVSQLRSAGAIPIGKTVTAEYAFRTPGRTRNPWNTDHTPGGSSSGSAAGVAAGMVPLALSTQTGGSIIRPAAYCGVVGFKPSIGLVSRSGLKLTCESLDVIGWHAASVDYAQTMANVLLPQMAVPSLHGLHDIKVAVNLQGDGLQAESEALTVLRGVQQLLSEEGATCFDINIKKELTLLAQAHNVIMKYEFARNLAPIVDRKSKVLSAVLLKNVNEGFAVPDSLYLDMLSVQQELRKSWRALTGGADLILTASAASTAPAGQGHTGVPAFNKMWSVLGWPCLHLPVTLGTGGMPVGVQLIADWHQDFRLLALAAIVEDKMNLQGEDNVGSKQIVE
ncbi:MAG: amidase [Advenella sp.]|uniref:amidase n=1 Tax=Advenella sp. S44 TaxID=1982755 RepID=UPI002101D183|nr:amidase [Advenella sp. S44]